MSSARGAISIDVQTCKGCELCVEACPQESLKMSKEINAIGYHYAVLIQDNCTGCVNCALVCPDAVITVYRNSKKAGKKDTRKPIATITHVAKDIKVSIDTIGQGRIDI